MATIEAQAHCGAYRGVHAGRRLSGVKQGQAQPALPGWGIGWLRLHHGPEGVNGRGKLLAAQRHGLGEAALGEQGGDLPGRRNALDQGARVVW